MVTRFLSPNPDLMAARLLYGAISERARAPVFYTALGVPDSIDGRFDLLVLHVFLVMEALKRAGCGSGLGTQLATVTFEGFEDALRELGVGDIGLSRRIKAMANAFYGRLDVYASAMGSAPDLAAALLRNLYRGDEGKRPEARRMADYAMAAWRYLEEHTSRATLMQGALDFGPLPEA
jgi:cytochrome b pre-mRNA-processing protein 3